MKNAIIKQLVILAYRTVIRPLAEQYVKKTDNAYDDRMLEFLDALFDEFVD